MKNVNEWLKQQRKQLEGATPGPWFTGGENVLVSLDMPGLPEESEGVIVECCDDPFKPKGWSEQRQKNADFIASVRTEHERALKIIEKYREALEYYAKQVEPVLEENYVSALALIHDIEHTESIQKLKLPARAALAYFPSLSEAE